MTPKASHIQVTNCCDRSCMIMDKLRLMIFFVVVSNRDYNSSTILHTKNSKITGHLLEIMTKC